MSNAFPKHEYGLSRSAILCRFYGLQTKNFLSFILGLFCFAFMTSSVEVEAQSSTLNPSQGRILTRMWAAWNLSNTIIACSSEDYPTAIVCDGGNMIVKLDTSQLSQKLEGTIPSEIGALTSLTSINLPSNAISGSFPASFAKLTALQELNLDNNRLNGSIPQFLSLLSSLSSIILSTNKLTGPLPTQFRYLKNLKKIYLQTNNFDSTIPDSYSQLTALELLHIYNCSVRGTLPSSFSALSNLREFKANLNPLSGELPPSWGSLTALINIHVADTKLTGSIPASWANMGAIQIIHFEKTLLSGSIPAAFGNLTNLTSVYLYQNSLGGVLPACWASLGRLELSTSPSQFQCPSSGSCCITKPTDNSFCANKQCKGFCDSCKKKSLSISFVLGIALGGVAFFILLALLLIWAYRRRLKSQSHWEQKLKSSTFKKITLDDVKKATDNFSPARVLGRGGFGTVYIGNGFEGELWAVKRSATIEADKKDNVFFVAELMSVSKVSHQNLVRIVGYCNENSEQILIYEYIPNGSLADHLYEVYKETLLSFEQRLEVAIGVAEGLNYLHQFAKPPMVHRDVKPNNILLDHNWQAKVADFGMVRAVEDRRIQTQTRVVGTRGYLDPDYLMSGCMGAKSDVYSFGVVLLELITGKEAISSDPKEGSEVVHITDWVLPRVKENDVAGFADKRILTDQNGQTLLFLGQIAFQCLQPFAQRPDMEQVLSLLRNAKEELKESLNGRLTSAFAAPFNSVNNDGASDSQLLSSYRKS